MKDELHIAILKFGKDKVEDGTTCNELKQHIRGRGYKVSTQRVERFFFQNYEPLDSSVAVPVTGQSLQNRKVF